MLAREPKQQVGIERLRETGIGNRGRKSKRGKLVGRLEAFGEPGTEREQRHLGAFAQYASLADLERPAFRRHRHAHALAARIAQRGWTIVDGGGGRHHVYEVGLVRRRHDHEARQTAEIGHVEGARMGRAIGADQPRAVHGEAHGQALDGDVVHHLIVGALQEGRVDRGERFQALGRKPRREGYSVLLGDADVEAAVGKFLGEQVEPGARRHRGGDGDDLVVLPRLLDQRVGVDPGIGRRTRLRLRLRAGRDVELDDAVVLVGRFFGRVVALALFRDHVDQERSVLARRARCSGLAGDGRCCARRSARHRRIPARRTACRR